MVVPDLVAYLNPKFLILSAIIAVSTLPTSLMQSAISRFRRVLSTVSLMKPTSLGIMLLKIIRPTVVLIRFC